MEKAFALLIGVGNDLPASARDAKALHKLLSNKELAGYKEENIQLLTDEAVTNKSILQAFDALAKQVDEDSSVFIYYSGHGGTYTDNDILDLENPDAPRKSDEENESHFYLVPNNWNPKKYRETWLEASEFKARITGLNTRRLILFLDCCHAEGMTKADRGINEPDHELLDRLKSPIGLMQRIDDGKGMSIISACRAEEKSWIIPSDAENSVFTNCLLDVLQGKNKDNFDEPFIRMSDVIKYVMKKVPEITPIQRPFVNLQMYDDFILSRLPKAKLEKVSGVVENVAEINTGTGKEVVSTFRENKGANAVIFVHGFSGEADASFGAIPEFIKKDPQMNGWDLFPLGYSANSKPSMGKGIWATIDDLTLMTDNLASAIEFKYKKYKRIALVGHSLGGLVIQQALLDLKNEDLNRVSHVLQYGTPSNGVMPNSTSKQLYDKLKELHANEPYIKTLRKEWSDKFGVNYPFEFKAVAGTEDTEIPIDSSLEPFDEAHRVTISGNHFTMIQPKSIEHDGYQLIASRLNNTTFLNQFTDQEAVNLLLGDYDAVIKKLLPNKDKIDVRGLKQLLFALEGMDRHDEVMDILNNHHLSKGDTDLLGMFGGRHKRKYLSTSSEEDGRKATDYYLQGFEISSEKNDVEQVYYHGINYAFMSLVYYRDKRTMREYAEKALEATKKDPFDNIWKFATMAEAYMYMANFDQAKSYYEKAAKGAGIREKLSIHTNAFMAYTSLMNTENDDFVKFLKIKFLS